MISGISSSAIPMTNSNGGGATVSGAPNPAATTAPIAAPKIIGSNTGEPLVQKVEINTQQIEAAVSKINKQLNSPAGLSFQIDPTSGDSVVTVIDSSNNTVIRQIPSELSLRIAQSIENQQSKGLLVSDKV
jgi:flagellar protein FlaG